MVTELTSEPADLASAGSPSSSGGRPRVGPVAAYVAIVTAAAAGVTAAVLWAQLPRIDWLSGPMATCYLFALLLVVGELRPLGVARKDGDIDQITVSSTWAGALVLAGPLAFVLLAQGLAVAVDDLLRRRGLLRCCFNVGQYVLTLGAARWAFCAASGRPYLELTGAFDARDIGPAVVAGVVFFVVNNGTVAVAVALNQGLGVLDVLREDVRVQGLTSSILLGLAPVAVVVAHFSVWMLPLLVLPLVGVQHSAWLAARRQHEALHDALTGLPNRVLFHRRTDRAIVEGTALGGDVAVMLLDLDHFKEVNDTLGHHVGDDLLRQVAHRVSTGLPDGVTLARLGGDEFAVLVPAQDRLEEVLAIAHGIAERLREPVLADGVRVSVQASIGIAHEAADRATRDLLLQHADIALYRAKEDRGDIQVYRPEIDQHDRQRLSLVGDMHAGIEADQFRLVYQPQVDTRTGQVVGVEALMRWRHPEQGEIPPDVFIPLAENSGAIGALTRRALAEATATLALLHEAGHDIELAVNLSARLLTDLELPRTVQQAVRRHGVPASSLTIEVTESTIAADPRRAMEVLRDLRETGVRVSVDDFGTGYSSLSYLRRLNPDELKVDRSFVKHMRTDENSAVIVRSTVELGHGLGLSVVAEGVEDAQTFAALQQLGCDRIQGFFVARPMSLAALKVWLDTASVAGWQAVAGAPDDAPADGQVASVRVLPLQRRAS